MILQISPPLPLATPKGNALAHFLIDYGPESDLLWVCFNDNDGECWTWPNKLIRVQVNKTLERDYISPFYDPNSEKLEPIYWRD